MEAGFGKEQQARGGTTWFLGKQYYLTYQKQEGDLNAGISFSDNFW
jgi:hypothetical protein